MRKVAITTTTFAEYDPAPLLALREKGFTVVTNSLKHKIEREEILALCQSCVAIIAGTEVYDQDLLKRLAGLKVISRCGAGVENIDLASAEECGIKVLNTPQAPAQAVAELTVGLIINLLRKISAMDQNLKRELWKKEMGYLLSDKKVGIIGLGKIGKIVARILISFGCRIVYADPFVGDGILGLKRLPLEELLAQSDIISVHISGKDKIIGEKELRLMKKGSWFINTSRGDIVEESVLFELLKTGHLAGAALDVFLNEPYSGPLSGLSNVILTPHIGSYAREARINMEKEAVNNLLQYLEG